MTFQFRSIVLFVKDMPAARQFYEGLLAQEVNEDFGQNVSYKSGFSLWEVDHASQIMYQKPHQEVGATGLWRAEVYFTCNDLDAALEKFTQHGVNFVHPLIEQPWGQRVFRAFDPDGYIVEMGEPMDVVVLRCLRQGMTLEQTCERTYMPREIVEQIAAAV